MICAFSWACFPHNKYTIFFLLAFNCFNTMSVNCSHPIFLCDAGFPFSTVKQVFKRRIPCLLQRSKQPELAGLIPRSLYNSMNIFFNEGGIVTDLFTEKLKPFA